MSIDNSVQYAIFWHDHIFATFQIEKDFGDKFILDDIKFEGMRHLIFVKKDQLELIRESRNWFIGGTYKMVQHPFVQLITIHRFVRSGDNSKQVPIVYILLSRRRRSDYIKVCNTFIIIINHTRSLNNKGSFSNKIEFVSKYFIWVDSIKSCPVK
jgi:hypothetical protein